jgi:hypothetical protein
VAKAKVVSFSNPSASKPQNSSSASPAPTVRKTVKKPSKESKPLPFSAHPLRVVVCTQSSYVRKGPSFSDVGVFECTPGTYLCGIESYVGDGNIEWLKLRADAGWLPLVNTEEVPSLIQKNSRYFRVYQPRCVLNHPASPHLQPLSNHFLDVF